MKLLLVQKVEILKITMLITVSFNGATYKSFQGSLGIGEVMVSVTSNEMECCLGCIAVGILTLEGGLCGGVSGRQLKMTRR